MGIRKPLNQGQQEPPLGSQTTRLPEDAAPPEGEAKDSDGPAAVAEGLRGSTDAVEACGVAAPNSGHAAVAADGVAGVNSASTD